MPPPVRWLLSLPDAVEQLERLDRDLITRRDLEELLGVSRSRAAALMRLFGAEMAGTILVLRRASLLRTFQRRSRVVRSAVSSTVVIVSCSTSIRPVRLRFAFRWYPRRRRAGWTACLPVSRSSLAASRSVSSNLVMRSLLFMLSRRLFWPTTTVSRTSSAVDLQTGSSRPRHRSFRRVRRPAAGRRRPGRRPVRRRRWAGPGPAGQAIVLGSSCVGGRVSVFTTSSRPRRPCRLRFG